MAPQLPTSEKENNTPASEGGEENAPLSESVQSSDPRQNSLTTIASLTGTWLLSLAGIRPLSVLRVALAGIVLFALGLSLAVWRICSVYHIRCASIEKMVWSPDGSRVAVNYSDYALDILTVDPNGNYNVRQIRPPSKDDSRRVWTMDWNEYSGDLEYAEFKQPVQVVRFLKDGSIFKSESTRLSASGELLDMSGNPDGIFATQWVRDLPDSNEYKGMRILNLRTGERLDIGPANLGSTASIQRYEWSRDNHLAILTEQELRIWAANDLHAPPDIIPLPEAFNPANNPIPIEHRPGEELMWSPDSAMVAVWGNWNILIYDLKRKAVVLNLNGRMKWSPDGKWLSLAVYDKKHESSRFVTIPVSSLLPLSFASTAHDTTGFSFPAPLHRETKMQESDEFLEGAGAYQTIKNLTWSPDGTTLATTYHSFTGKNDQFGVNWWDIASGKPLGKIRIPTGEKRVEFWRDFSSDFNSWGELSPNASHLLIVNRLLLNLSYFNSQYFTFTAIRILRLSPPSAMR